MAEGALGGGPGEFVDAAEPGLVFGGGGVMGVLAGWLGRLLGDAVGVV